MQTKAEVQAELKEALHQIRLLTDERDRLKRIGQTFLNAHHLSRNQSTPAEAAMLLLNAYADAFPK